MFYWLFTLLLLALIFIGFSVYIYFDNRVTTKNILEKIRNKWGRPVTAKRNFKLIAAYLDADDDHRRISPATAKDLDLDNIFNFIDRTNSKPGKQYLYKKLFTPETSFKKLLNFDSKLDVINRPRPDLEKIECELAKLNSPDAYYLTELFLMEHKAMLPPPVLFFTRYSGAAIIGLIVLLYIVPNIFCFVLLTLLFITNGAFHFGLKTKISYYTRSLPQLLILNNVAKTLLTSLKIEKDELIKAALQKLSGLNRSLSVVNFESQIADNPENFTYAVYKFVKVLFLLEPFMFITSVSRINKYRKEIRLIYDYVGEVDSFNSHTFGKGRIALLQ